MKERKITVSGALEALSKDVKPPGKKNAINWPHEIRGTVQYLLNFDSRRAARKKAKAE